MFDENYFFPSVPSTMIENYRSGADLAPGAALSVPRHWVAPGRLRKRLVVTEGRGISQPLPGHAIVSRNALSSSASMS